MSNEVTTIEKKNSVESVSNSLTGLFTVLTQGLGGSQLSQTATQYFNLRGYLITNDRYLLNQLYAEHGIVQTLVDQPVDDGYREGVIIRSSQLEPEDITQIESYLDRYRIFETLKQALKWSRLFGGGALILMTDQKPDEPLEIDKIDTDTRLEFRAADLWEFSNRTYDDNFDYWQEPEYYMYYGKRIHKSRVSRS